MMKQHIHSGLQKYFSSFAAIVCPSIFVLVFLLLFVIIFVPFVHLADEKSEIFIVYSKNFM